MNMKQLWESWQPLERRTKLMTLGTALLVAASICLSFSNCTSAAKPEEMGKATVEEGVTIAENAEPIPSVNEKTQLVASLVDILSNEECVWLNPNDPLCSIQFTEQGYFEYYGDIQTICTWEFYEIEVTSNGRSGVWRITYPDGSTHDARFTFIHDSERGIYTISSSAFEFGTYEAVAFTSGNVLY